MSGIVCATRGSAGSLAVQHRAIRHAKERKLKLIFLYVVDMSRISQSDEKLKPAVRNELHWIGRTLLHVAQQRAKAADIASEIVIREGEVVEEICRFINERSADLLLLGAPRGTALTDLGDEGVERLAKAIQAKSNVAIEIVRPEILDEIP